MEQLWIPDGQEWSLLPLKEDCYGLEPSGAAPAPRGGRKAKALLVRWASGLRSDWAVLAARGAAVRVNGQRLLLGVRVLGERDAIQVGDGEPVYFSAQGGPVVVAFPAPKPVPCARCSVEIRPAGEILPSGDIRPADLAVRCPGCGAWHHQGGDWLCWTYDARCACCDRATDLNQAPEWTPLDLQ